MAKTGDGTYKRASAERVQRRGAARTAAESALTEVMAGVRRVRNFAGAALWVEFIAEEDGLSVEVFEKREDTQPIGKWRVVVL